MKIAKIKLRLTLLTQQIPIWLSILTFSFSSSPAHSGPILDEILNPMKLDQYTPQRDENRHLQVTSQAPVGQTFITSKQVYKIMRIALYVAYWNESWEPQERLTLTLWDSPEKKISYGRFTIDYQHRRFEGGVLIFDLNARVQPHREYYFELTTAGGDGEIFGIGMAKENYPNGKAYIGSKPQEFDLWFETHVKKKTNPQENLRQFFDNFNLEYPGLQKVKEAVQKRDWEAACKKLVEYFESREDLFPPERKKVRFDPTYDTYRADLAVMQKHLTEHEIIDLGPNWNWMATWPTRGGVGLTRSGLRGILANAYAKTGNDKYAKAFNDMIIDFFLDLPSPLKSGALHKGPVPPPGISGGSMWSSISAAARLGHGFHYYSLVAPSPYFELDTRVAWISSLIDMAEYLEVTEAGGNWEMQNSRALFEFGANFPELKKARKWAQEGLERLQENLLQTTFKDGVQNEAAMGYHCMYLTGWLERLQDAKKVNLKVSPEALERLEKMFEYILYSAQPDGFLPPWGDSNTSESAGILKQGAQLFKRPDMLFVATAGKAGKPPKDTSKAFPEGGYYIMRSDWGREARYLNIHNGPWVGGHGHQDLLSIVVHAYGSSLIIDPGIYIYGTPEAERLHQTQSHSTVVVDGQSSKRAPGASLWQTTEGFDYFGGTHSGFSEVEHHRRIFFIKPDYWVISDLLTGKGRHNCDLYFQIAPAKVTIDPQTKAAQGEGFSKVPETRGAEILLIPVEPEKLAAAITEGIASFEREKLTKIPTVRYSQEGELPLLFQTVIYPYLPGEKPKVSAVPLKSDYRLLPDQSSGVKIIINGQTDYLVFQQEGSQENSFENNKLQFRGSALCLRQNEKDKITQLFWVKGERASFNGVSIASSEERLEALDIRYQDKTIFITLKGEPKPLTVYAQGANKVILNRQKSISIPEGQEYIRVFEK